MTDEDVPPEFARDAARPDPDRAAVTRQAWSVGLATGAYGVSFGALAVASGLAVWQAVALSALMFTGGSQFALVGVVAAGGTPVAAVLTAAGLGVRNAFYGVSLASILPRRGAARLLAAHLTIDESTAVATAARARRPDLAGHGLLHTGLAVWLFWTLATLLGALAGDALGDPRRYGLDAAAAAAFLALLWPRLRERTSRAVAASAVLVALAAVPWAPVGTPVLCAGLVAVVAGLLPRRGPAAGAPDPQEGRGAC